jgi:peptide chain release factor subunit 3
MITIPKPMPRPTPEASEAAPKAPAKVISLGESGSPTPAATPAAAPAAAPTKGKVISLSAKPASPTEEPKTEAKPKAKVISLSAKPEPKPAPEPEPQPAAPAVEESTADDADDWEAACDDAETPDATATDEKASAEPASPETDPKVASPASPASPETPASPDSESGFKKPDESKDEPEKKTKKEKKKKELIRDPRPHLNLVFIGHVDAGKSTISGHLLYCTGMVDDRTLEKFEREAKSKNRESWKYAWAMDIGDEERDKGKTHETGTGYFETKNRRYTILDAPGHKAFVPSMIGGACQADVGILVISARKGEFETGFEKGGQTREHAILAKTAGVRFLIVVINKMDDPSVEWKKERYDEILEKLNPFLKGTGYSKNSYEFIPISGLAGINLSERLTSDVCPWFSGPSLLEKLDSIDVPESGVDEPLRFPVQGKFRDMGIVIHGTNVSGAFSIGDKLVVCPTKRETVVEDIIHETETIQSCFAGDNVQLRLKNIDDDDIHVGYVLAQPGRLVGISKVFTAQLLILECKNIISGGYQCVLHLHAMIEECQIKSLLCTLDKKTGKILKKGPPFVKGGETVLVRIEVPCPIAVEPFKVAGKLGRFILRDEGKTIAVGVVTKLVDNDD